MNRFIIQTIMCLTVVLAAATLHAEVPTVLTDNIYRGDGIINVLKDVSSDQLQQYLTGGTVYLGVDINEDASGNESSKSAGVAIKEIELLVRTTEGDFSFREFYTNTVAMITEAGASQASAYFTLFGASGGSQITGGTTDFNLSTFDDIIEIRNVSAGAGTITGAQIRVTFLDTARAGENESFFDYSGGFEQFALLGAQDAQVLDSANIGLGAAAPSALSYTMTAPAATPEPGWFLLLAVPALYHWKKHGSGKQTK